MIFIGKKRWDQLLQVLNRMAYIFDKMMDAEDELIVEKPKNPNRNMVTIKTDISDDSLPSERVLDLSTIRDYMYFENGTFKGHHHNGDTFGFYGDVAKKLHTLLSDTTHGRIGYEIDLRRKEVSSGERDLDTYEPDHDPYN